MAHSVLLQASFATTQDTQGNAVFFWRGALELVLVTDVTEPGLNPNRIGSGCSAKEVDFPS